MFGRRLGVAERDRLPFGRCSFETLRKQQGLAWEISGIILQKRVSALKSFTRGSAAGNRMPLRLAVPAAKGSTGVCI